MIIEDVYIPSLAYALAKANRIGRRWGPSPVEIPLSARAAFKNFSAADSLPWTDAIFPKVRRTSAFHHRGSPLVSFNICNASEAAACASSFCSNRNAIFACKFKARESSPFSAALGSASELSPNRLEKSTLGPAVILRQAPTAPEANCRALSYRLEFAS